MDISIIVPCYNLEDYISPLLYSLHMVNFKGLEYEVIFVIEEDTKDRTEEIIHTLMKDMNYHVLKSNEHSNGAARNIGLDFASGEYIWFVDGDDWITYPEIVQLAIQTLKERNLQILQIKFISNFFNFQHYSMVWQYIFRYDLIKDIRFWNKPLFEDNDYMDRVLKKVTGELLTYISIPSYFYNYERPGSNIYRYRRGEIKQ